MLGLEFDQTFGSVTSFHVTRDAQEWGKSVEVEDLQNKNCWKERHYNPYNGRQVRILTL